MIALFYGFSTWTITLHYGPLAIKAAALANPGNLYLTPIRALLGKPAFALAEGLLLTSVFAAALSFHATIARYLSGVAREGLCDTRLGVLDPVYGAPHRAGLVQTLASIAMALFVALLGVDPFSGLFAWAGAFASLGVLAMQFFMRRIDELHRPAASRSGVINQRRSTYPSREPVQTNQAIFRNRQSNSTFPCDTQAHACRRKWTIRSPTRSISLSVL